MVGEPTPDNYRVRPRINHPVISHIDEEKIVGDGQDSTEMGLLSWVTDIQKDANKVFLKNKFNTLDGHTILFAKSGEFVSIKSISLSVDQRMDTGVHRLVSFKNKYSDLSLRIDSRFVSTVPCIIDKLQDIKKVSLSSNFEMDNMFWMPKIRRSLEFVSIDSDKESWNLPLKRRKMDIYGDLNSGSDDVVEKVFGIQLFLK